MELKNEFSVSLPIDQAWSVLTDLERIAPCMPGFELQEVEGKEYRGVVKVKVGPIIAQYKGVASFQERDEANHRAVVRAEGRDTRGQGNASATVTATLAPERDGTRVTLHTDLSITGKVAQFGRGVLADVSSKLLGQFVQTLEANVLTSAATAGSGARGTADSAPADGSASNVQPLATRGEMPSEPTAPMVKAASSPRLIEATSGGPIDLLATAGSSVLQRVVPLVGVATVVAVLLWLMLRTLASSYSEWHHDASRALNAPSGLGDQQFN